MYRFKTFQDFSQSLRCPQATEGLNILSTMLCWN